MRYIPGTRVKITYTGTVLPISDPSAGNLRVERDHCKTVSYIKSTEVPHIEIEVLKPEFDPKAGEVYLVRHKHSTTPSPWFVIKRYPSQIVEMVSLAGVFSVDTFKEAYINNDYVLVKATVEPEKS